MKTEGSRYTCRPSPDPERASHQSGCCDDDGARIETYGKEKLDIWNVKGWLSPGPEGKKKRKAS
jgi:hypothetical protein